MQIITGKYRARKLEAVPSTETRPTLARVKESIFSLIGDKPEDGIVLDLFAGSGAYGAECISRGAKKVFFVDASPLAISTIKKNTKGMSEEFEIIKSDFLSALDNFEKRNIKFDLVFLDPPYKSGFFVKALENLAKKNLLSDDAIVVVEHSMQNDLQNMPNCYIIEKSRKYGIAFVDILKFEGNTNGYSSNY